MIEVRHLRYLVAIAEELNFRRAAERIHIDKSPLSRAVRDLEGELACRCPFACRAVSITPERFIAESALDARVRAMDAPDLKRWGSCVSSLLESSQPTALSSDKRASLR